MPGQRESSTTMRVTPLVEVRMRGDDDRQRQPEMWSYVPLEQRVPRDHPLRSMRTMVDAILAELSPAFAGIYSGVGRPSIAPEKLLRALLLQALYSIRSERLLMEQLDFNLLFRWFVGLAMDDPIRAEAAKRALLSEEHFTVDGTLIEAWAGLKSFQRKDTPRQPPDDPGNPTVNFHGETRRNATHASTTDPEARLARKGKAHEAKLCYQGHVLMENRHGLAVDARLTPATGYAEREAALAMAAALAGARRVTLGADKGYDTRDFVAGLRGLQVTPHVAQNTANRSSAIDGRTTSRPGYVVSQRKRKLVEEIFGWLKTTGLLRKTRHRGTERVGWMFVFGVAVYNLIRIRNLAAQPT